MRIRLPFTAAMAVAAILSTSAALADVPLSQSKYLKEASVDPATARATALKSFPGTIVDEELEIEKGGSGLRYSFDILKDGTTHEVGIDAKTGAVLEDSVEGPNAD